MGTRRWPCPRRSPRLQAATPTSCCRNLRLSLAPHSRRLPGMHRFRTLAHIIATTTTTTNSCDACAHAQQWWLILLRPRLLLLCHRRRAVSVNGDNDDDEDE